MSDRSFNPYWYIPHMHEDAGNRKDAMYACDHGLALG